MRLIFIGEKNNVINYIAIITYQVFFSDLNFMNEFMHGDPDHRIVLAKKIIQIFTTIKLKHDALELNAKKHNKFSEDMYQK